MISELELVKHMKYISTLARMAVSVEPVRKARLASCLVHQNTVVAFGINQLKSHPFQFKFSKNDDSIYLHSEVDCIKNSLRFLDADQIKKSTLYVCRVKYTSTEKKSMIFGLAKPCIGCARAITSFGIKKVVYTENGDSISVL